jgi:4-oxalocrotonate tautomerase
MPTLTLKFTPPLDDTRRLQARGATLTEITHRTLGKRRDVTALVIEAVPMERWTIGGQPPQRPTVMLELTITAGTNTAPQKARFVHEAFDAMQDALSPARGLEPASYVRVHELPATDWGYGGLTQAERRRERERAAV